MNKTNIEHLVIGLLIQLVFFLCLYAWFGPIIPIWLGSTAATFWFVSREHAQYEYKIGDPSKLVGYEALAFWKWSTDAKLDAALPSFATNLISLVLTLLIG